MVEMTIQESLSKEKLASMEFSAFTIVGNNGNNPWSSADIDKLEIGTTDFQKLTKACRFFYRKDPIVSSTLNKLVDIGVNELLFSKNGLTDNEFRIFLAIKEMLEDFAQVMAMEFLISGLVVPEIRYGVVTSDKLKSLGIKKYPSLKLPVTMFIRDPATVEIKSNPLSDQPSYFVEIPPDMILFIRSGGKYADGTSDPEVYNILTTYFPDFVSAVMNGTTKMKIPGDLIIRRKPQPDDPYPVPYLSAALESLKHKRNLRRMDYAIAARVISAIQLFRLGDKDFPVTEDDKDDQFDTIKSQMLWRDQTGRDVERIFQLFANHTLQVDWIVPPTEALLNEQKYVSVNQDIIFALGFPRILITGETEKSSTSQPEYAMMSPARTMENFREKILEVIRKIVIEVASENNLKSAPEVKFKPLALFDYQTLLKSLADLYAGGNLSRTSYADTLGYSWTDEMDNKEMEQKVLEDKQLGQFAPLPNGVQPNTAQPGPNGAKPGTPGAGDNQPGNPVNKTNPSDKNAG